MKPFEIFFHNNGAVTFQTKEYYHYYDASQVPKLVEDFKVYQSIDGPDVSEWEGNQPEFRETYSPEHESCGFYYAISENYFKPNDSWYNVEQFFRGIWG